MEVEIEQGEREEVTLPDDVVGEEVPKTQTQAVSVTSGPGLEKFTTLKGIAAPLRRANVDTDLIIPARFLKTIKRTGLGTHLFDAIRYDSKTGQETEDFVLNKQPWRQAKILVITGANFGCGSSREHAPWALKDFGIKALIAPTFADIHKNNLLQNGMLPISSLSQSEIETLAKDAEEGLEIEIDLPEQIVRRSNGETFKFDIEPFKKHCLVNGLDDIGLTLNKEEDIKQYEVKRKDAWPWLEGISKKGGKIPSNNQAESGQKIDW